MSYAAVESSVQSARPMHLYEFVQGAQSWRYASAPTPASFNGYTWQASALSHSDITQSSEMAKDGITLEFPRDDTFARQFLGYAPDIITSVTIYRGHLGDGDGDFVTYWKGRVAASRAQAQRIVIECESVFTSLRRPGLRARYQRSCWHALYGAGCTLDPESFAVTSTASTVSGVSVSVAAAASQADGWYLGGMLRAADGALRMISGHAGAQLVLSRPIDSLAAGQTVKIYPGCDRNITTCNAKFNNLDNYGGFPWIPDVNPFGGNSIA